MMPSKSLIVILCFHAEQQKLQLTQKFLGTQSHIRRWVKAERWGWGEGGLSPWGVPVCSFVGLVPGMGNTGLGEKDTPC